MSVPTIRKFRISLKAESAKGQSDGKGGKTQGLRTGDIVRRQYFDGKNIIYSLMCVLDYGVDEVEVDEAVLDANGNYVLTSQDPIKYQTAKVNKQQPWFVGALLEGDVPMPGEVLDFVRITSLFDQSRSGALYLTASDDESPFMDVIDGIGRNCSLTWPENINNTAFDDPQSQYILDTVQCETEYISSENGRCRICRIKKHTGGSASIKQTFSQYIKNPNQVLISFWAKASAERTIKVNLSYVDDSRTDGEVDVKLGTNWQYYLIPITVDYSGRHRRAVTFNLSAIQTGEEFYVADFNAILLSSVANFGDASQIRVGKLSGITDPVFGKLDSYGGYFQKLFATTSAHISGTLTAGDENGFGSTFYAGKIHKNAFVNSLEPSADVTPMTEAQLAGYEIANPIGMGQVFEVPLAISLTAQTNSWLKETNNIKIGREYTFSFWTYCMCAGQLTILQNTQVIGTIQIPHSQILGWHRQKVTFKMLDAGTNNVVFSISAAFNPLSGNDADSAEQQKFFFTAPQLESGSQATQYQPTDDIVTPLCEDYGAWFNRGGIGGTIQNPLIRMNDDGTGAISSRNNTFRINQNGSGHIAKGNILWQDDGDVSFSEKVKLSWNNLSQELQNSLADKSIKIIGPNVFEVDPDESVVSEMVLNIELNGIASADSVKWYRFDFDTNSFVYWKTSNGLHLTVKSNDNIWSYGDAVILKSIVTSNQKEYFDAIPIQKQYGTGYTLIVSSSQGLSFKNGECQTVLKAQLMRGGKIVTDEEIAGKYGFVWEKYRLPDTTNVVNGWWEAVTDDNGNIIQPEIDRFNSQIILNYTLDNQDLFKCKVIEAATFPYTYPVNLELNE